MTISMQERSVNPLIKILGYLMIFLFPVGTALSVFALWVFGDEKRNAGAARNH